MHDLIMSKCCLQLLQVNASLYYFHMFRLTFTSSCNIICVLSFSCNAYKLMRYCVIFVFVLQRLQMHSLLHYLNLFCNVHTSMRYCIMFILFMQCLQVDTASLFLCVACNAYKLLHYYINRIFY